MSNLTISNISTATAEVPTWGDQLFCGIAQTLLGSAGILANILTVCVVTKSKKMRSTCFLLIGGHAAFCFLMAIGWLTNGIHTIGFTFNLISLSYTRLSCYLMYLSLFLSVPPSSLITFLIALDRTLGIMYPTAYEKMGNWFAIGSLISALFMGVVHTLAAGLSLDQPGTVIQCFNFFSPLNLTFVTYYTNFNLCLSLLSVVNYALIYTLIAYKKRKIHTGQAWSEGNENSHVLQRQISLLPIINLLMVAYCIFGVIPPMVSVMLSRIENGRYLQRGGQYTVAMKASITCIDFCVLALKSKEFRNTLKNFRQVGQSKVMPASLGTRRKSDWRGEGSPEN